MLMGKWKISGFKKKNRKEKKRKHVPLVDLGQFSNMPIPKLIEFIWEWHVLIRLGLDS